MSGPLPGTRHLLWRAAPTLFTLLCVTSAQAAPRPRLDTGDTAFVLLCAALVLLMTPGLALFYGGLVRSRSVLNTMMMSFAAIGIAGVAWVLVGYSLAFGPGNRFIGDFSAVGLTSLVGQLSGTIPAPLFAIFQIMFAIITLAVVSGAIVERMRFSAFVLFGLAWTLLVYAPLAHWVWSPHGWLSQLGLLDFAGGTVVEIASGTSGLVAALVLGPRFGYPRIISVPHNVPFVLLGTGLLWFGWLGFNAGSALSAGTVASYALLNTNTAAAAALLAWMLWDTVRHGKPTAVGAATGAVVGLVAVTPACGFVTPLGALVIGLAASSVSFWLVSYKQRLFPDDALDVFACHGAAGIVGTLLTGVLAVGAINPQGHGLIDGHPNQILAQLIGVLATAVFSGGATFVILRLVALLTPLRMTERQEVLGIDVSLHQEEGYQETDSPVGAPVFMRQ
jgi:ammonium transporter, Amt family